jgi:hypothetical protein
VCLHLKLVQSDTDTHVLHDAQQAMLAEQYHAVSSGDPLQTGLSEDGEDRGMRGVYQ